MSNTHASSDVAIRKTQFQSCIHNIAMTKYLAIPLALALIALCACVPSSRIPPILIASGEMVYPQEAKAAGIQGHVTLSYDVDIDGRVQNVAIIESNPPDIFDESAIAYLKSWRFQPAKFKGTPVASENRHSTIGFSLENADSSYVPYLRKD